MNLLDLGEIRRITCVEGGRLDECTIEIVGECGMMQYDTGVVLSRNRFEHADGCRLWNIRTECLLSQWQQMKRGCYHNHDAMPKLKMGAKVKLPSTLDAMKWAKVSARTSLGSGDALRALQGERVNWVNADGEHVKEPKWFRPMFAIFLLYGFQNSYGNHNSTGDHFERMHDEYVLLKLVLDAYAGKLSPDWITGETFEAMTMDCDELRKLQREFNRDVKSGLLIQRKLEWSRRFDGCGAGCGEYNYQKVHCDFDDAMREAVSQCREQLNSANPKCVDVVGRYTPFRYPGTQVTYDVW